MKLTIRILLLMVLCAGIFLYAQTATKRNPASSASQTRSDAKKDKPPGILSHGDVTIDLYPDECLSQQPMVHADKKSDGGTVTFKNHRNSDVTLTISPPNGLAEADQATGALTVPHAPPKTVHINLDPASGSVTIKYTFPPPALGTPCPARAKSRPPVRSDPNEIIVP